MTHILLAVSLGCLSLPAALTHCHPCTPALGPTSGFSCGAAPCACCPRAGFADYTPPKKKPSRSRVAGSEPCLSPRGEVSATPLSAVAAAAPHLAAQRSRSGSGAEPSGPPAVQFSPLQASSAQPSSAQPRGGAGRPPPSPEEPPPSQPARRRRAPQPAP